MSHLKGGDGIRLIRAIYRERLSADAFIDRIVVMIADCMRLEMAQMRADAYAAADQLVVLADGGEWP